MLGIRFTKETDGESMNKENINWFYEDNGKKSRPLSEDEIIELIKAEKITYGTLVWNASFDAWKKIEETQLKSYLHEVSPPPISSTRINNTIVWILAFAPIIGIILEYAIAYTAHDTDLQAEIAAATGKYFYITLMLNIGLCWWDEISLKRAGHDTKKFKGWIWLVPVYLFQRAKTLGQNLAYFIVWMICFLLIFLQSFSYAESFTLEEEVSYQNEVSPAQYAEEELEAEEDFGSIERKPFNNAAKETMIESLLQYESFKKMADLCLTIDGLEDYINQAPIERALSTLEETTENIIGEYQNCYEISEQDMNFVQTQVADRYANSSEGQIMSMSEMISGVDEEAFYNKVTSCPKVPGIIKMMTSMPVELPQECAQ